MTIHHTCPSEVIQAMQIRIDEQQAMIDRLRAALHECHLHMAHEVDPEVAFVNQRSRELLREDNHSDLER